MRGVAVELEGEQEGSDGGEGQAAGAGATLHISNRARDEGSGDGNKVEGKHLGPARLRSETLHSLHDCGLGAVSILV